VTLLKGAITDYGAQIDAGGVFSVGVGGEAQTVYVGQGGVVSGAGALMSGGQNAGEIDGVTLYGGLADAGVTSAVHIASGALDNMSAGAAARGDYVQSGGEQIVSAGATATLEQVLSGGQIVVSAGGVASEVTVSSGGSATFQTIVSSGVTQTFALPGSAASATFGSLKLDSGATAILQDAVVLSGGKLVLDAGVAVAGGTYYIVNGYSVSSTSAGVTVSSGGSLTGAGGVSGLLTVFSGGVASGVSVLSGGTDLVDSGARQSGVKVDSGAVLDAIGLKITGAVVGMVSAAETVAGATVSIGAQVTVSGAAVADGGSLQVLGGGYAEDVSTVAGGVLTDGGTVIFDQPGSVKLAGSLSGGGVLQLTGSGITLVLSGAGSHFTGEAVIDGAAAYNDETEAYSAVSDVLEIATASGLGTGAVEFEGFPTVNTSATLQVDAADTPAAGATFANALNNFTSSTDFLDLRGLAYVAGASAKVSGSTLTLTDGGRTEKFTLTGETAATFTVTSDGHGGTLIAPTAPPTPAVDAKVVAFTHAAAAFAPSDAARTALASSTAPAAETPFLHAGASARAERL
jgi:hypothetical protein